MSNFNNTDRVQVGTTTQLTGSALDDTIALSGTFLLTGTTTGIIEGGTGSDRLELTGASLAETAISGVETTALQTDALNRVLASEIANLGTLVLEGTAASTKGNIQLEVSYSAVADFSGLVMDVGQVLYVSGTNFSAGRTVIVDFSGGSYASGAAVEYEGSYANDSVLGGPGDDTLVGGANDDTLDGGSGDDVIEGGGGFNTLRGGIGNDTLVLSNGTGSVDGGDGADLISVDGYCVGGAIEGGTGSDRLELTSANLTDTTISGIEQTSLLTNSLNQIEASQIANLGALMLDGAAAGAYGWIRLMGDNGDIADFSGLVLDAGELLHVESNGIAYGSTVTVDFSGGNYAIGSAIDFSGYWGNDSVLGGSGDDTILGGYGDDTLNGGAGDDVIEGGYDNDTLKGGGGTNTLNGGTGDDWYVIRSSTDVITDASGYDVIEAKADYTLADGVAIERLLARAPAVTVTGNDLDNDLRGGNGGDTIAGAGGDDTLRASGGATRAEGGDGSDNLVATGGDATLAGGTGDDRYYVLSATTTLEEAAGEGDDRGFFRVDYALAAGVEIEVMTAREAVSLTGNELDQRMVGSAGADTLDGGPGGKDVLIGEGGADVFVFGDGWGRDKVLDFEDGTDVIDLSGTSATGIGDLGLADTALGARISLSGNYLWLEGMVVADLDAGDFVF